jgi:hypothetical protein
MGRRGFLWSTLAASGLVSALARELAATQDGTLAPAKPHHAPRAKRLIVLYMSGGVSHVDTFDPKPKLTTDHGKTVTVDHPETRNRPGYETLYLKKPLWAFHEHGQSGIPVSELLPEMARCVDRLCVIRSMETGHSNHYNASLGLHTGSFTFARPSLGSWVSYGLGSPNKNLPSFVVIAPATPYAGTQVWASNFLPASHQGTLIVPGNEPMRDLARRVDPGLQRMELETLGELNARHLAARGGDDHLAARIRSFETAYGMQTEAPEVFDLSGETDETLALYGLQRGQTTGYGWQCLVARRLAERGVRMIELIDSGSAGNWDAHGDMITQHVPLAKNVDRPIYGLLTDLERRGLLEETLVVWTTEFGRTPFNNSEDAAGREHHPWAFTSWLAGAGVKAGHIHGATDEHGIRVVENAVTMHDFHATILHLMGLDHLRLTYRHAGRDYRLTDVHGQVVTGVLA